MTTQVWKALATGLVVVALAGAVLNLFHSREQVRRELVAAEAAADSARLDEAVARTKAAAAAAQAAAAEETAARFQREYQAARSRAAQATEVAARTAEAYRSLRDNFDIGDTTQVLELVARADSALNDSERRAALLTLALGAADSTIAAKDSVIAAKNTQLAFKDEQLEALRRVNAAVERQVAALNKAKNPSRLSQAGTALKWAGVGYGLNELLEALAAR